MLPIVAGFVIGIVLGYFVRQSIAKRRAGSLEARIEKMAEKAKVESKEKLLEAKDKAVEILEEAKKQEQKRQESLSKMEDVFLRREDGLDKRTKELEEQTQTVQHTKKEVEGLRQNLTELKTQELNKLEQISGLSKTEAKNELLSLIEKENEEDLLKRLRFLEAEGKEKLDKRAQEIIASSLQRYAGSVVSEVTTTYVNLPSEELKGKIIGKEGRNIKALERLTGVDIVVDETPDSVMISSFDPIRRQIARVALEELIQKGVIQPTKIEEAVALAREKINEKIREAGEAAIYDVGIGGIDPRLTQLLGRMRYRTSFWQNALLHSIEAAHIAGMLASELGADVQVAKKGALFHDIGKAIDHEVQGTHIEIGRRILEKFNVEKAVIMAMQAHHGDYPYETVESIIVQVAEAISAARPGARKDTVEIYLKRLEDIEQIVNSFEGIEKSYAIQAGREVRVFVTPEKISDLHMHALARSIAKKIEQDLRYPGEIKVNVIRETRVVEYAR